MVRMYPGFPLEAHERKAKQMVDVRNSTIPGAGRGVFATVDIPSGTDLGWYRGEALTDEEFANEGRDTDYTLAVYRKDWAPETFADKRIMIDGRNKGNWTALINAPKGTTRAANCYFSEDGRVITKTAIPKDGEILVGYGKGYWNARRNKTSKVSEAGKKRKTRKAN
jgi:hypothetical protein